MTAPATNRSQTPASTPASPVIRPAAPSDLPRIEELLVASGLPTAGVAESLDGFLVAEHHDAIVGVVGIEECCEYGLLRSTAIAPSWRSRGFGRQLVERAIAVAEANGVHALYLLTTTAERYFPSFGFRAVSREAVPRPVQESVEFRSACPASATAMALRLAKSP